MDFRSIFSTSNREALMFSAAIYGGGISILAGIGAVVVGLYQVFFG